MKILYFSWIKERVGMGEEDIDLPADIRTVSDLLDWLKTRNEMFDAVLEHRDIVRVAIDQQHAEHDQPIGQAREIALFPPMTGG